MSLSQNPAVSHVPSNDAAPKLDNKRHIKYFLRCLKTYLPQPYTSNDSNRLSLAFFILCALDLLDALDSNTTPQERADYTEWIYRNQNPEGGFRAFPGSDFGHLRTADNANWDPAHVPATYFALCLLLILEDDFSRFDRQKCLNWLHKLQRPDGSFGETLVDGEIQGGSDSRFGYCAAGIWYILTGSSKNIKDSIDTPKLVECVRSAETYDGAISDLPFHEAHAGFTFCGLGILSFLKRLSPLDSAEAATKGHERELVGPSDPAATIRWLVSRQTPTITQEDEFDTLNDETDTPETCHDAHTFITPKQDLSKPGKISFDSRPSKSFDLEWTGFNGRCNKIADTCYAFWVTGALHILGQGDVIANHSVRRWLLERTAHTALGGFGKIAGDLPDVYHGCLGLAALSLMRNPEDKLQELDATMCISKRAKDRLIPLWKRWGIPWNDDHASA